MSQKERAAASRSFPIAGQSTTGELSGFRLTGSTTSQAWAVPAGMLDVFIGILSVSNSNVQGIFATGSVPPVLTFNQLADTTTSYGWGMTFVDGQREEGVIPARVASAVQDPSYLSVLTSKPQWFVYVCGTTGGYIEIERLQGTDA